MDELVYLIMEIVSLIVDSVDVLIKYVKLGENMMWRLIFFHTCYWEWIG